MTPATLPNAKTLAAREPSSARRSLIAPVAARRTPRRLTGRRGNEDVARARAAFDADDHALLVSACGHHGYELLAPIGDGGMGRVWLARATAAGSASPIVAIKAMLPKVAHDGDFRAMFVDEGRIASRIQSPHVVRILGLHERDEVLFQVLEWVDGESLLDLHLAASRSGKRLPLPVVLRAIADACDGLHAAHQACDEQGRPLNVVHRDVSPANVLVAASGEAKLVDFGIAKARARVAQSTMGFAMKGRVLYVSPEYALGHPVDHRADTWSMGATLYFLLCGRAPYAASNDAATVFKLTSGEPVPPLPPTVPAEIAAIAYRALERDPNDRFASAAEMRDALASALVHVGAEPSRLVMTRFVSEHESPETRARREMATSVQATPAPTTESTESLAVRLHLRAIPGGTRGIIMGAAIAAVVLMTAIQCALLFASGGELHANAVQRVAPVKAIGQASSDVFTFELPATPAPPPRVAPPRPSVVHAAPPEAHPPPETHPAPPPAPATPPRPARRHYGF